MKGTKILLIILALLMLSLSAQAYFRDPYWECTSQGEASQGDFFGRRAGEVCTSTCCKLCVAEHVQESCLGGSAQPMCACQDGSGAPDVQPPQITFNSPQNGHTYSDNDIVLDVTTDETTSFMKRAWDSEGLSSLCSHCSHATITKRGMADGTHTVRVQAKDLAGNINETSITFIVDTTPPVIQLISPGNNAFVEAGSEQFEITYSESSVQSFKVYYKKASDASYQSVNVPGCANGNNQVCSVSLNFAGYPQGSMISMYVEIKDMVSTTTSPVNTLTVDNGLAQLPFVIESPANGSVANSRSVSFSLQSFVPVKEFLFSKDGVKFTSMCKSNCMLLTKTLSLDEGDNTVTIRMLDMSNNQYQQTVSLFIDSKKPSISKVTPAGGSKPIGGTPFVVTYSELEDVKDVTLFYGAGDFAHSVVRHDCPVGKNVMCEFNVDLSPLDGQIVQYYVEVKDRATAVQSKVQSGRVDTSDPILTAGDLASVQGKQVMFGLTVNEPVTLEYQDNGGKFTSLCTKCTSYNKAKSFTDGAHTVLVQARDDAGNVDQHTYAFIVDSAAPKPSALNLPDFIGDKLLFKYVEVNPTQVVAHYRKAGTSTWTNQTFTHCEGSTKGNCTLDTNLESLQGQDVEVYVSIKDIANNEASTKIEVAHVDTLAPVMGLTAPADGASYVGSVPVAMSSNELVDFTFSDNGKPAQSLCSNCGSYNKVKSFSKGSHTVVFIATDDAGNKAQVTRTFMVS